MLESTHSVQRGGRPTQVWASELHKFALNSDGGHAGRIHTDTLGVSTRQFRGRGAVLPRKRKIDRIQALFFF